MHAHELLTRGRLAAVGPAPAGDTARVQTFLPYPSFARSAAALDNRRLGRQRVETLQILRALHLEGYGWKSHPAVLIWRGHARALVAYGLAVVHEWCGRGFADTTRANIAEFARPRPAVTQDRLAATELPPWLGWSPLHRSHQSALVRKDPAAYAAAFPGVPGDLPYVWPEPPARPPPVRPFTAWVVRAPTPDVLAAFRARGLAGVPGGFGGGRSRKQRRQFHRLREDARTGERVLLPADGDLVCGVLAGPPAERRVARERYLVRPVDWRGALPRSALVRPYQLQDPQLVFALRGERLPRCDRDRPAR